jgi:hypothetical protein
MSKNKTRKVPHKISLRYKPKRLSKKDSEIVSSELKKSIRAYKKGKYHTRKRVKSFKSKESKHIKNAKKIYDLDKVLPNKELAKKTKCRVDGLKKIVSKGQGAYFSSGSRPNQTPHSWGIARLASSVTGGKSSIVDRHIIEEYCEPSGKAYKLANKAKNTMKVRQVPKVKL